MQMKKWQNLQLKNLKESSASYGELQRDVDKLGEEEM